MVEEKPVRKILYQEDVIRAKYYKTYGNWEVVNLFNDEKSTAQTFVDKYLSLAQAGGFTDAELWDRAVSSLELEGVNLGGKETLGQERGEVDENGFTRKHKISFQDLFNKESK